MMYAMTDPDFFRNFLRIMGWAILAYSAVILLFKWHEIRKMKSGNSIQNRLWRRFIITNRDILPILSSKEREEAIRVVSNTIKNSRAASSSRKISIKESFKKIEQTYQKNVRFCIEGSPDTQVLKKIC